MSAESLFTSADKKTKKFLRDYEGAQELFLKAAVQFKMGREFIRAGDSYMRAAECAVACKDTFSAEQSYASAVGAYQAIDSAKAAEALNMAVKLQINHNRLGAAAALLRDHAMALCENGLPVDAIPYYEKAMHYFDVEGQKMQSLKCMTALAQVYGEDGVFNKALEYYERAAYQAAGGPLKFQARDYFFSAMLCRFALLTNDNRIEGSEECREALERYMDAAPGLRDTREMEFLECVLEFITDCDVDKFDNRLMKFERLLSLDKWRVKTLTVVKQNMESLA